MMAVENFATISYAHKVRFYDELIGEIGALCERYWFTNLSNVSAALMAQLPELNWVGFYLLKDGELRLGPFQGRPACLRIPLGKGVCGTAAAERRAVLVPDVHLFPGHIVCDERSRSELVLPLLWQGRLLGVLDLDSPRPSRFDSEDVEGLSRLLEEVRGRTDWADTGLEP
jgi:GAF domain-containing protein